MLLMMDVKQKDSILSLKETFTMITIKPFNFGLESFDAQTLNAFILESKKELHDDTVVITGPFDAILK
jgi:hypothetical protein